MRGHFERRTCEYDPNLYAPERYRRTCAYDSFVPDPLIDLSIQLPGETAGVVSDAEAAIAELNRSTQPALAPLARLLLRTESIASSKVEGLQVDARSLARAEAKADIGVHPAGTAMEVLANIDAMQLAVEEATAAQDVQLDQIVATHRALMVGSPNEGIAGVIRSTQNWIGGNDYNPCGADFVPPPPELVHALMEDRLYAISRGERPLIRAVRRVSH
jgi:Fic family protein